MAIICDPLININLSDCLNNVGGNKRELYVWLSSERGDTLTLDNTNYTVDTVEYLTSGATASLPINISVNKDGILMEESNVGDSIIMNQTNTVTITVTVNNRQYDKSKAISILGAGQRDLDLVVSQSNGTNWFVPNATLSQADSSTGQARADGSNYTLTFTAELDHLVYGIETTDLVDLVTTGKIQ